MLAKNKQGFTMLELLISIAILGIVVPALSLGLRGLIVLNNRSRDLALTSMVAENKVEQLRSSGFNSLTVGTYNFSNELPGEISNPKTATYTISNPSAGIKNIDINITYWDYTRTKTMIYKSVVSELGVGQ
jgi:prepilin-type N-terminal cleavage/methylation domain-containing protein